MLSHHFSANRSCLFPVSSPPAPVLFWLAVLVIGLLSLPKALYGQAHQDPLPYMSGGPNSAFAHVDFSQIYVDGEIWDQGSIASGSISALDMAAPDNAMQQFSHGTACLKDQNFKEAIKFLQKAVEIYPKFVSAHIELALAYRDQQDPRAKQEFETAASLDDRFPVPFANLGVMALEANDFPAAEANLAQAASLSPGNARILTALAFAQNADHKYQEALQTVERVHARDHHGIANIHYIGAAAAISLNDSVAARRELQQLLSEDPSDPLAPIARNRLEELSHPAAPQAIRSLSIQADDTSSFPAETAIPKTRVLTFPNSEHLAAQLTAVSEDPDSDSCDTCNTPVAETRPPAPLHSQPAISHSPFQTWGNLFTFHQNVDETALFFSVSEHGHAVNDLSLSDIQIRDDNKPPDRVLQFIPQARLPLRLGLLIDSSDSVKRRVSFEKQAAQKFLQKVLTSDSDLAFVAGFNTEVTVTQDFTRNQAALNRGIELLSNGGNGTSVFDAAYYACWKLAAYPDSGRVAKVLVILTDGEDNSSHRSLRQAIEEAETAGVTVYTLSTSEEPDLHTDANRILKVLAERTGGEALVPVSLHALDRNLNALPDVIRSRYLVAYKAADFEPDGKYRTIQVKAEKAGKRLRVHVRRGYFAPLPEETTLSMR